MRNKISQKQRGSTIVLTSLVLFNLISGQFCYGGFHPDRSIDGTSWSDSTHHLMKLEQQISLARANLTIPKLGWDDLNYLSAIAETKTSALFQTKPRGFPDDVSYLKVKASIFLHILEISLLSQGSRSQWLFEEEIPSLPLPSSIRPSDYSQSETNGEKWFGFIKVIDGDKFIWTPDSRLEAFPLLKKLIHTLTIAYYIEPRLKLFLALRSPVPANASGANFNFHSGNGGSIFRIMKFDFLRKSLESEVSGVSKETGSIDLESESIQKLFSGRVRNTQSRGPSEYFRSVLMTTQPASAFLPKNFFLEMGTWFSSLSQGSLYTQQGGLGLASHKQQVLDELKSVDRFSLERMKANALLSNHFYQFTLIQDFIALGSRGSCLKLVR
ncbi:MAG: hypothetical protein IPK68_11690 [Bdellovibrionales bacterium]|nr:hypothetical protein [Bdellovibrionales bacterium]